MEKQYQDKVKKASRDFQLRDFRQEQRELKQFVSSKNLQKERKSREKSKPLLSEYSTTDQENRHQQPVFFL